MKKTGSANPRIVAFILGYDPFFARMRLRGCQSWQNDFRCAVPILPSMYADGPCAYNGPSSPALLPEAHCTIMI